MKPKLLALAASLATVPIGELVANTGANVQCWAPGMGSTIITMTSYGQLTSVSFGRPFRYEIYGVAGRLTLGNLMHSGGINSGGRFSNNPNSSSDNHLVDSTTSVKLLVNSTHTYPRLIAVTGPRPGFTFGPARLYGGNWITNELFGYPDTTIGFKLAGTESGDFVNKNPYGYFYVVGEYHAQPPMPVGWLTVDRSWVLAGLTAPVGYSILRAGSAESVPPFTDYDPNQGVIDGTAPDRPTLEETIPLPPPPPGTVVIVTELETDGSGWKKVKNNRSGLYDGTNPGRGSGRTNSPNTGTLNPGGLEQGLEPIEPT